MDEGTDPSARVPSGTADAEPDAIFDRFVANAYAGAPPVAAPATPAAPIVNEARWVATVEELLDDGGVTEVGARPVVRVADAPATAKRRDPPSQDTDVTRAVVYPSRPGSARAAPMPSWSARAPAPPPAGALPVPAFTAGAIPSSEAITSRHQAVVVAPIEATALAPAAAPMRPTPALATPLISAALAPAAAPQADHEHTLRVVLLNKRKAPTVPPPAPEDEPGRPELASPAWQSVVRAPSTTTQRREALLVVPEVAKVELPPLPMPEGSEDGMAPGGELDRKLGDMAVLLRYGHEAQVGAEIDALQAQYPRDLLMLRRIAEFWVATGHHEHARELLFSLATGLFERRNVEGMRQALEQVLVLDPGNERASRLIALLEQRPDMRDR